MLVFEYVCVCVHCAFLIRRSVEKRWFIYFHFASWFSRWLDTATTCVAPEPRSRSIGIGGASHSTLTAFIDDVRYHWGVRTKQWKGEQKCVCRSLLHCERFATVIKAHWIHHRPVQPRACDNAGRVSEAETAMHAHRRKPNRFKFNRTGSPN